MTGYPATQPYGKIEAVLFEKEALHRAAIKLTSTTVSVVKLNNSGVFEIRFFAEQVEPNRLNNWRLVSQPEQLAIGLKHIRTY